MFVLMISIFLAGITLIALEDKVGVNKSAIALLMAVVLWVIVSVSGVAGDISENFIEHLGDVSETIFFVMGALVIVELTDAHGGFRLITNSITTNNKRKLLWIISFLTFFLSAMLDNIATGLIMIALLRKLIPHRSERIVFASMIIIAANAGGSFSPIGDVTTILLWTGGNLSPLHQVAHLFLPALASMLVPLFIVSSFFKKDATWYRDQRLVSENAKLLDVGKNSRFIILFLAISTMLSVPIFNEWTHLPPFMRVLLGMAILWIYTDLMYGKKEHILVNDRMPISKVLTRIDMPTLMFFLGILMSVAALNESGQLGIASNFLSAHIPQPELLSFVIGIMSSFVDNVALVAATMGMYPLETATQAAFMTDGSFWTFLAYCAVTGGSLLIIGSATGVTIMGMEKISFGYYLKRFSLIALLGYLSGAGCYFLLSMI